MTSRGPRSSREKGGRTRTRRNGRRVLDAVRKEGEGGRYRVGSDNNEGIKKGEGREEKEKQVEEEKGGEGVG